MAGLTIHQEMPRNLVEDLRIRSNRFESSVSYVQPPQRVDSGAHHTALYRAVVGQMFADMIRLTDGRVRCVTCENRVVKL